MNRENVNRFLKLLGAANCTNGEKWVSCSCPLAPWLHDSGKDSHPSFAVKIAKGDSVYNCFGAGVRVITRYGVRNIEDMIGGVYELLDGSGEWVEAPILCFGEQEVVHLTVRRNRTKVVVPVTRDHEWFVRTENGRYARRETCKLKVGDRLKVVLPKLRVDPCFDLAGFRWGCVYGDGCLENKHKTSRAYLYGMKDTDLSWAFVGIGKRYEYQDKAVITGLPPEWKTLPLEESDEVCLSWLAGYLATDGCVSKEGCISLSSAKRENLEFISNRFLRLGIATYGISVQVRSGKGKVPAPLYHMRFVRSTFPEWLVTRPHHRARLRKTDFERAGWVVDSISADSVRQSVYCAVVKTTHSFTLDGFLHTSNCFTCGGGGLDDLLKKLSDLGAQAPKYRIAEAMQLVAADEDQELSVSINDWSQDVLSHDKITPFPEPFLATFPSALNVPVALKYLTEVRHLPVWVVSHLDVRFDLSKSTVVFPIRDFDGVLVGLRGRYINPGVGPRYHAYKVYDTYNKLPWYGEQWVDTSKQVVMVESVFDVARTLTVFPNVVAPLSVGITKDKARRMDGCHDILTLFDGDTGGQRARDAVDKYFSDAVVRHVIPPKGQDPGSMTTDEISALIFPKVLD